MLREKRLLKALIYQKPFRLGGLGMRQDVSTSALSIQIGPE